MALVLILVPSLSLSCCCTVYTTWHVFLLLFSTAAVLLLFYWVFFSFSYPDLKLQHVLNAHPANCICIEFDPTGHYFATGSADALVSLWDLYDLVCVRTFARWDSACSAAFLGSSLPVSHHIFLVAKMVGLRWTSDDQPGTRWPSYECGALKQTKNFQFFSVAFTGLLWIWCLAQFWIYIQWSFCFQNIYCAKEKHYSWRKRFNTTQKHLVFTPVDFSTDYFQLKQW